MAIDTALKRIIAMKRGSVGWPNSPIGSSTAISRGGLLGMYYVVPASAPAVGRRGWTGRLRRYLE